MQDTELVRRRFQRSCQIPLSGCYLCHDCVVTKLGLLRLSHGRNALVNAEGQSNSFQPGLGQVIAQTPQRFQLTGNTRLQFLHGVLNRNVEKRAEIIAELSQVLTHKGSSVGCITETGQQSVEYTLISNPVGQVDTQGFADGFSVLQSRLGIIAHSNGEQVHVLLKLVRLGNDRSEHTGHPSSHLPNHNEFQTTENLTEQTSVGRGFPNRVVVLLCSGNQLLNSGRESGETIGHLLHFVRKRLHGSGKIGHLPGELVNVCLFQFLNHGGELSKLIDEGGQFGLFQLRQRAQTVSKGGQLIAVRPFQAVNRSADCRQLIGDRAGNFHIADLTQGVQRTGDTATGLLNISAVQALQSIFQLSHALCSTAQTSSRRSASRSQTTKGVSQSVKTLNGLRAVIDNLKFQTLNFHIISHVRHHLSLEISCWSQ